MKRSSRRVKSTSPKTHTSLVENSYYALYSIATLSFALGYALNIPSPYPISTTNNETQQLTRTDHFPQHQILSFFVCCHVEPKRSIRRVRRTSPKQQSKNYTPHSTATSSFTPQYTLGFSPTALGILDAYVLPSSFTVPPRHVSANTEILRQILISSPRLFIRSPLDSSSSSPFLPIHRPPPHERLRFY